MNGRIIFGHMHGWRRGSGIHTLTPRQNIGLPCIQISRSIITLPIHSTQRQQLLSSSLSPATRVILLTSIHQVKYQSINKRYNILHIRFPMISKTDGHQKEALRNKSERTVTFQKPRPPGPRTPGHIIQRFYDNKKSDREFFLPYPLKIAF
jgi:hypothetical protein